MREHPPVLICIIPAALLSLSVPLQSGEILIKRKIVDGLLLYYIKNPDTVAAAKERQNARLASDIDRTVQP